MSSTSGFDLSFRPAGYWDESDLVLAILARLHSACTGSPGRRLVDDARAA
jgi:hypothetical protein